MFAAGPTAIFALGDTLARSERVYLTLPGLSHNDYTSQGEMALTARTRWKPDADGALAAHAQEVGVRAEQLRSLVILYLRAKLKGDRRAGDELTAFGSRQVGVDAHVEIMKVGESEPAAPTGPPTPRSVHRAYRHGGAAGAIDEMSRADRLDPALFDDGLAFQLMFDLAASGRAAEISPLFDFFLSRGIDVRPFLVSQEELFARIGRYPEYVDGCVGIGRVVARDDAATAAMVARHPLPREPAKADAPR